MKTSSNGRKFIEGFEGLILQAYDDHNDRVVEPGQTYTGTLTIGYGHTTAAGLPAVFVGQKITQAEADQILGNDLTQVENQVNGLVKVPLTQNQFDALVSFQFNTGALGHSSALPLLNAKNYTEAADHLTLYNMDGRHVRQGLVRRRAAEKALFLTPDPVKAVSPVATTVAVGATATAVAVHSSPSHFWWIVGGVLVAGLIIDILVQLFKNKGTTNVNVVN